MSKKVLMIHGGDSFPTQEAYLEQLKTKEVHLDRMKPRPDWKRTLESELGEGFEVFQPRMPMGDNANYGLWKLWFERVLNEFEAMPVIVGHSLGAMFLIKYYSEVVLTELVPALFLVAPEYWGADMPKEEHTSFTLSKNLENITNNAEKVLFYHSRDDFLVDFSSQGLFMELFPEAEFITCEGKGHFLVDSFPEIVKAIKEVA